MMTMSRAQVTTFLVQVLLPLLVVLLLGPIHCRADVSAQPTPPSGTAVPDYAKAAAQYQSTQDIVNRVWPKLSPEVRSYLDVQLRPRSQVRPMVTAPGSVGISAAAANAATQDEISGRCVLGLRRMISLANLTSPATLASADAAGKPASGLLAFNTKFWGDYGECEIYSNVSRYCLVSASLYVFSALVPVTQYLGYQPHQWGFCVPKECTEHDVSLLFTYGTFNGTSIPLKDLYRIQPNTSVSADCTLEIEYEARHIASIFICAALGLFVLLGTTIDWLDESLKAPTPEEQDGPAIAYTPPPGAPLNAPVATPTSNTSTSTGALTGSRVITESGAGRENRHANGDVLVERGTSDGDDRLLFSADDAPGDDVPLLKRQSGDLMTYTPLAAAGMVTSGGASSPLAISMVTSQQTMLSQVMDNPLARFLLCFSLLRNARRLLDTNVPKGAITCINGIRVLSITWVILGHTFLMCSNYLTNPYREMQILERFTFQTVSNAFFAVDTFFFLSGLLVMYLSLKQLDNHHGKMPWFKFYFHRVWRLTPAYMIALMILYNVLPFFGTGPTWPGTVTFADQCKKYWWTNLLYINNFYPKNFNDQCFSWAWYLANDMQFYIISPLFLILMYRSKLAGTVSMALTMIVSWVVTAALCAHYNFAMGTLAKAPPPGHNTDYTSIVYEKPYCRISPYLVGLFLGAVLRRGDEFPFVRSFKQLPRGTRLIIATAGWLFSGVLFLSTLFGLYHQAHHNEFLSKEAMILYVTFARPAWSLGLAWMVWACHSGYGNIINSLLSMSFWIPLSRLTYSVYLVHFMAILVGYGSLLKPFAYTDTFMIFFFLGYVFMSFLVAAALYLAAEAPFLELEKIFFHTHRSATPPRPATSSPTTATRVVNQ
ncbi:nose resistant to fluoxetine protein 6-like [Sycon ciliatum]|uniref:nose resistant to fluoxetine protein 6-like n=1 Tax=Sycon ciliatum TaxID=27933 RepID=UPI0031F6EF28|eukprot:scpid23443/ scgid4391/ Nose resistant to fluoxetine protein 6